MNVLFTCTKRILWPGLRWVSVCGARARACAHAGSEKGCSHPRSCLWTCCPASSGPCGWDIKTINFQKLETLRFLWKDAKIISQTARTCVWGANPPEAARLSPFQFLQSQRQQTNITEVNEVVCKHARAGADHGGEKAGSPGGISICTGCQRPRGQARH